MQAADSAFPYPMIKTDLLEIQRLATQATWQGKTVTAACPTLGPAIDRFLDKTKEKFSSLSSDEKVTLHQNLNKIAEIIGSNTFAQDPTAQATIVKIQEISKHLAPASSGATVFESPQSFQEALAKEFDQQLDPANEHKHLAREDYSGRKTYCHAKKSGSTWKFFSTTPYSELYPYKDETKRISLNIDIFRKAVFSAMKTSKNSVTIPMVKLDDLGGVGFNDTVMIDHDALQKPIHRNDLMNEEFYEKHGLNAAILERFLKPALIQLLTDAGCLVEETILKGNFDFGERERYQNIHPVDVKALKISWNPEVIPSYPLPSPPQVQPATPLNNRLTEAYQTGARTDFEFQCRDGSLKAHKLVLALASNHFAELQDSAYKEAKENVLQLPDTPKEIVKACLDYIYLGKNPDSAEGEEQKTFPDPVQVFKLSHLWNFP